MLTRNSFEYMWRSYLETAFNSQGYLAMLLFYFTAAQPSSTIFTRTSGVGTPIDSTSLHHKAEYIALR